MSYILLRTDREKLRAEFAHVRNLFTGCRTEAFRLFVSESDFYNNLYDSIHVGVVPNEFLRIKGVEELRDVLKTYYTDRNVISGLSRATGENLYNLLTAIIRERMLREQLNKLPLPDSLEVGLAEEHARCKPYLDCWNKGVYSQGYDQSQFDAHRLFFEVGIGMGRVVTSLPPILIESFQANDFMYNDEDIDVPWYLGISKGKVFGYHYAIGFVVRKIYDKNGRPKDYWRPAVMLDREVLDMWDSQGLTPAILEPMNRIFGESIHDTVHQAMMSAANIQAPRKSALTAYAEKPLSVDHEALDMLYGVYNLKHNYYIVSKLELHAELTHRDIMRERFKLPGGDDLKEEILKSGIELLTTLTALGSKALEIKGGEKLKDILSYSAAIAMTRFYRLIEMEDPYLNDKRVEISSGRVLSFKEAVDEFSPGPYCVKKNYYEQIQSSSDPTMCFYRENKKDELKRARFSLKAEEYNLLSEHFGFQVYWSDGGGGGRFGFSYEELTTPVKTAIYKAAIIIDKYWFHPRKYFNDAGKIYAVMREMESKENPGENNIVEDFYKIGLIPGTEEWAITKRVLYKAETDDQTQYSIERIISAIDSFLLRKMGIATFTQRYFDKWYGDWLFNPKTPLWGMNAFNAATLFEGSKVPGILPDFESWSDPKYPVAKICVDYYRALMSSNIQRRPNFVVAKASAYPAIGGWTALATGGIESEVYRD